MAQELEFFPHQPYNRASATLCTLFARACLLSGEVPIEVSRIDVGHENWNLVITDWTGVWLLVHHAGLEAKALYLDLGRLLRIQVLENLVQDGKELLAVFLLR